MIIIPIEISARHLHLSQKDLEILFGLNYQLTPIKNLSQPGQFACEEAVEIQNLQSWGAEPHMDFTFGKAPDHNQVRILGPVRKRTQIELSWSDFICLGLKPVVALSGDYKSSGGGVIIVGPAGEVKLTKAVIIPQRHIHCSLEKAREFGLRHGQTAAVKVISGKTQNSKLKAQHASSAVRRRGGNYNSMSCRHGMAKLKTFIHQQPIRQITFHNVAVRINDKFDWQMHIDTDEANAAGICGMGAGEVVL
ncbi:MAG: PduL/EutD family phosphate acyltransferase [Candidatus Jacksonbacteria bacterium]